MNSEARKAEKQADLEAAMAAQLEAETSTEVEAETMAEAETETEAQNEITAETADETQDDAAQMTEEERAERAERRAERRAQDDLEEIDPTAEEPQQEVAAAASADAEAAEVVETEIDEENSRQSDEEFAASMSSDADAAAAVESDDDDGLSNFQKALLLGIGAVTVGSLLNNNREVVANTGDRVVVEGDNGLEIYRDDDALLRQPGADLRTETFSDGSSRSTLTREDGTQVVTIRNAQGQVLRRSRIFADGTEVELFDDLAQSEPVDVRSLREMEPAPVNL